jgi:NAD(P)-dependent dehydrogenase (short-subunit alcohol dehydrogenase family)
MWAKSFATNVTGVFSVIQALLPNVQAAGGKIAILSSIMGSDARAPGGSYIYRASKAAVLNLGRNLSADLAPRGMAVGIYHPGWVQTDMGGNAANVTPEDSARGLVARFDALSLETTGVFEGYDGVAIPF